MIVTSGLAPRITLSLVISQMLRRVAGWYATGHYALVAIAEMCGGRQVAERR